MIVDMVKTLVLSRKVAIEMSLEQAHDTWLGELTARWLLGDTNCLRVRR